MLPGIFHKPQLIVCISLPETVFVRLHHSLILHIGCVSFLSSLAYVLLKNLKFIGKLPLFPQEPFSVLLIFILIRKQYRLVVKCIYTGLNSDSGISLVHGLGQVIGLRCLSFLIWKVDTKYPQYSRYFVERLLWRFNK